MDLGEIVAVAFFVVIIIGCFAAAGYVTWSAVEYWQLKEVINTCNSQFGEGSWYFTEFKDHYSCSKNIKISSSSQTLTSTSTSTSTCSINGKEVNCSEIK